MIKKQPYNITFESLYDMEAYIGKEFGLSDWMTIDQESINAFAKNTEDEQWIHIDPERCAKESPYKKTIAHGFMVLSLASKLIYEVMTISDLTFGLNYGFDKVRFMNATVVDSRIRGRFSLLEFEKKDDKSAKYKMKIVFEIEGEEKPACVAEWLGMGYTA